MDVIRTGVLTVALFFVSATFQWASASVEAPDQVVRDTTTKLMTALSEAGTHGQIDAERITDLIREILLPHVDMQTMARWVLGQHWRRASAQQRSRFAAQFEELLLHTYAQALATYGPAQVRPRPYKGPSGTRKDSVTVDIVRRDAPPVPVTFRMFLRNQRWLVYDVKLDGISLVASYRSSFSSIIRSGGIDKLITHLEDHNTNRSVAS